MKTNSYLCASNLSLYSSGNEMIQSATHFLLIVQSSLLPCFLRFTFCKT